MKTTTVLLPSVLAIVILAAARACAETTIVVDFGPHPSAQVAGHSEADVNWLDADTADDTTCTECFAALELQRYLRKMTARPGDFAIVDDDKAPAGELILVGGPASNAASRRVASALGVEAKRLAGLGLEGYRIKSGTADGRRVTLIAGGSRVGTLYGSYDLLYRLGCRWFGPGELHEELPRIERLAEFDVTQRPAFSFRGFQGGKNCGNPDFLLWVARNRLNYCDAWSNRPLVRKLGIQMPPGGGGHRIQARVLNPSAPYPYNHAGFDPDNDKPKDPYPVGPQYQGDANQDGRLSYYEAHPEWFGLVGGRRSVDVRACGGTNYCTSNPHATAEFMKNFIQALVDGPYREADVVRFWPIDCGKWCECPQCKALGSPIDRHLLSVHRLDREIKKARAEGRITRPITIRFPAYLETVDPPTRPLPPDFDYATCIAAFFPIFHCYAHNFDDPNCPTNARYQRQLRGWAVDPKRHYRGQFCVGEYYNVSRYKCLPVCYMHIMANDIPYYYKAGTRYFYYMHVTTGNWGNKALTNYQMARQLWDVDTDCEALWKDYFARRYGPAAPTMRRFYESLEKMLSNIQELKGDSGLGYRLSRQAADLFPTSHLRYKREPGVKCDGPTLVEIVGHSKTCRELINKVLGMELPERIKGRANEDERMFTYGERTITYYHECVQAFQLGRAGRLDEARRHYAQAKRIAELLRQDTTSATMSSGADAPNALDATRVGWDRTDRGSVPNALVHLAKLLGSAK